MPLTERLGDILVAGAAIDILYDRVLARWIEIGGPDDDAPYWRDAVTRLEGTGDNEKATVEFRNAGTKQLLLKFARYKIVQP